MKIKTLNEWLNESNQGFLEPTKENLRTYKLDPKRVSINPDGSIDYDGDVDLHNKSLTSIPFNFNKVKGKFDCSWNQLVNLVGGPEKVEGEFRCVGNRLVSLAGGPREVQGGFYCSHNHLVSLEGSPEVVGGDFDCSDNRLVSLEGCPREGIKSFNCSENQLVSLEGCPGVVEGNFNCSNNQLVSLAEAPREVNGGFDCRWNQLVSLEGSPEVVGGKFRCYSNHLVSLAGCPNTIEGEFLCSSNPILYNPTKWEGSFDINHRWYIQKSAGKWVEHAGSDHLRMAFERLGELSKEEILGIEKGLKKVNLPNDLRSYCEDKLYKFQVKYNPKTKTQKFFHDAEMDDDLLGMI